MVGEGVHKATGCPGELHSVFEKVRAILATKGGHGRQGHGAHRAT
jgi:hypothetical protein